jgi:putative ABC transport system permease protein
MSDLRYAIRRMRRSPGFTAVAVVVLALGIGVNTALFSVVNALFFKPLPVRVPDELVCVYQTSSRGQVGPVLFQEGFDYLKEQAVDLIEFTSHSQRSGALSADGMTERVSGESVRSSYFDLLGVKPMLGRVLGPQEDDPANPELALVISHDLWARRFQSDPSVVGKRVELEHRTFTIVGVAAPGFRGVSDIWTPSHFWVGFQQMFPGRQSDEEAPIGRLKPGVSFERFRAFVEARTPQLRQLRLDSMSPDAREKLGDGIRRSRYPVFRASDLPMPFHPQSQLVPRNILVALTVVVGLVLIIASANIAGLLLARGVMRTAEIAVRRALGAAGLRVTRQLLTETVLLSLIGGVLGLVIAWNVVALFRAYTPATFVLDVPMDLRVLFFAVAVCIGAGVLVGVAPALQAAKVGVLEALGSGIAGARHVHGRLKHWIVVPQVGLSLVLLTVAAIHVRALTKIELKELGYRTDQVVMSVWREEPQANPGAQMRLTRDERNVLAENNARKERLFSSNVLERVQSVSGVTASALAERLPASAGLPPPGLVMTYDAFLSGSPVRNGALRNVVSDGYFDVVGLRLLAGRAFDGRDAIAARKVAIISEALGARLWNDRQPIGKQLTFVGGGNAPSEWLEVIGVVNEVNPILSDTGSVPEVYVPVRQQWWPHASYLVVRGAGDQAALVGELKKAVSGADPYAEVWRSQTMRQVVADILYPRRTAAAVLTAAGLIGLALACIGLYGVVSYAVAQRLREIGIRATLGAERRDLVVLLLKDGAATTVIGCLLGLILTVIAHRLTVDLLPGLPRIDIISLALVPPALGVVVLLACYLPARRAASTDPSSILRTL